MAIKRKDIRSIMDDESLSSEEKAGKILNLVHAETDELRDNIDDLTKRNEELTADVANANNGKTAAEKALNDYKSDVENKAARASKESAYIKLLKDAGVSENRIKTILKVTNIDEIEVNKDGSVKGADKLTESIRSEYADFITQTNNSGAETTTPPANAQSRVYSREDISKMSAAEINSNWDAIKASLKSK